MHAEEGHGFDLVLIRLRIAGEDLAELVGKPLPELLLGKASVIAIGDAPQSILCDLHGDEPMLRMDGPLDIRPAVFIEVVVYLHGSSLARPVPATRSSSTYIGRYHLFVQTIAREVSAKQSFPNATLSTITRDQEIRLYPPFLTVAIDFCPDLIVVL